MDEDIRDIVHDPIIAQIAAKFLNLEGNFQLENSLKVLTDYRSLCIWSDEVLEKPPNQPGNGTFLAFFSIITFQNLGGTKTMSFGNVPLLIWLLLGFPL